MTTATKKKTAKPAERDLRATANRIWLAGLGALATATEEGSKLFDSLVERGEGFESRGRREMERAKDRFADARQGVERAWKGLEETLDERVAGALNRLGVPSRDEIRKLSQRVAELTAKVEKLRPKAKSA